MQVNHKLTVFYFTVVWAELPVQYIERILSVGGCLVIIFVMSITTPQVERKW